MSTSASHAPELVLYYKPSCPYCARVLMALEELKETHPIAVRLLDVSKDSAARAKLLEVGGKATVPCLFVGGKPLYESADIVAYLRSRAD